MAVSPDPAVRLQLNIELAEKLIDICKSNDHIKGSAKLSRKIKAECKFLRTLHRKDHRSLEMHLNSTNLIHLQAVVDAMVSLPAVSQVMKTFHCEDKALEVSVDIVCNHGYTWTKVIARKPAALHLVWAGGGQFGDRSIVEQAVEFHECAAAHPKHFTTPQVVFIFVQGITKQLKEAIERIGVVVQGKIEDLGSDLENKLEQLKCSYDEDLNGDESFWDTSEKEKSMTFNLSPESSDSENELISASAMFSLLRKESNNSSLQGPTLCSDSSCDYLSTKSEKSSIGNPDAFNAGNVDGKVTSHTEKHGAIKDMSVIRTTQDMQLTGILKNNDVARQSCLHVCAKSVNASAGKTDNSGDTAKEIENNSGVLNYERALSNKKTCNKISNKSITLETTHFVSSASNEINTQISSLFSKNSSLEGSKQRSNTASFVPNAIVLGWQPVIKKLNLDITTLISYVSNLCHGYCNYEFQEAILTEQAAQERKRALLPELNELFQGKELCVCHLALQDFKSILTTVGGPTEKLRAEELLQRVNVIPDDPCDRIAKLQNSAKLKARAKVIFGTGERIQAMTVTANTGFVRAAAQRNIDLCVHLHPSRALTEQKQATAKLLQQ